MELPTSKIQSQFCFESVPVSIFNLQQGHYSNYICLPLLFPFLMFYLRLKKRKNFLNYAIKQRLEFAHIFLKFNSLRKR